MKLVKKTIYPWKRILILYGHLIQFVLVYTRPKEIILVSHLKKTAPQGETFGCRKPYPNTTFICPLKSFNSIGAIVNGRIDIR